MVFCVHFAQCNVIEKNQALHSGQGQGKDGKDGKDGARPCCTRGSHQVHGRK